jgi:hypothetical protein
LPALAAADSIPDKVKAFGCEIIFPGDGNNAGRMKKFATFLLVSAACLITYGITRWLTFKEFVVPDSSASEGDPRFYTAFQRMFTEVTAGVVMHFRILFWPGQGQEILVNLTTQGIKWIKLPDTNGRAALSFSYCSAFLASPSRWR